MVEKPTESELQRRFLEVMSGDELAGLHRVFHVVDFIGDQAPQHNWGPDRPDLRHSRLPEVRAFRIRVDVAGAGRPLWRLLEIRSDCRLSWLHEYLLVLFRWGNDHIHRFSLGGGPFDEHSQLFWCLDDEEASLELNASSIEDEYVRLDEALQHSGDVLFYSHGPDRVTLATIRLEDVYSAEAMLEPVIALGGAGGSPCDYLGALRPGEGPTPLDDPVGPDLRRANLQLRGPCAAHQRLGRLPRRLQNLIDGLADTATGAELRLREELLRSMPPRRPAPGELEATLGAFRWFLDTAAGDGLPLTAAGYLSPSAVQQACRVLPRHPHLDGAPDNREAHTPTVRRFRQSLCAVGLLEQRGSRLVLTEAGAAAQAEPQTLWEALRAALPAGRRFQKDATLLLLLEAATSPGQSLSLEATAWVLNRIGWRIDEQPLTGADLAGLPAVEILGNLTPGPAPANDDDLYISTTASLLAHEALMGRRP